MNHCKFFIGLFVILCIGPFHVSAQECGLCSRKPTVVFFDLELFNLQKPADETLRKSWDKLYYLSNHIYNYINRLNSCIRLEAAGPQRPRTISKESEALYSQEYFIYGWVRPVDNQYQLKLFFSPACKDKILGETDDLFQLTANWDPSQTAQEVATKLTPLIQKILNFETEQHKIKKLPLGGNWNGGAINIEVVNPNIKPGEQTDIMLEMKDCDGSLLANQEIQFSNTTGGVVNPAKVKTDAQGRAKASYKLFTSIKGKAVINAHSKPFNVKGCEDLYVGSAAILQVPEYEIEVYYIKQGMVNVKMKTEDSIFSISIADEDVGYAVTAHTKLYHYPADAKSGTFYVDVSPYEKSADQTVFILNEGYSNYSKVAKSPEMTVIPMGVDFKLANGVAEHFTTNRPRYPRVQLNFEKGLLSAFQIDFDFEGSDQNAFETGGFFCDRGDEFAKMESRKIKDPKSFYKTEYVIRYAKTEGETNQIGSLEVTETAYVRILTRL